MNIIDVKHITDDEIEMFEEDLKAFLLMIRDSYDREKLKTVIATHRETWYAIGTIKKDKRYIEYINQISDADIEGGIYGCNIGPSYSGRRNKGRSPRRSPWGSPS